MVGEIFSDTFWATVHKEEHRLFFKKNILTVQLVSVQQQQFFVTQGQKGFGHIRSHVLFACKSPTNKVLPSFYPCLIKRVNVKELMALMYSKTHRPGSVNTYFHLHVPVYKKFTTVNIEQHPDTPCGLSQKRHLIIYTLAALLTSLWSPVLWNLNCPHWPLSYLFSAVQEY